MPSVDWLAKDIGTIVGFMSIDECNAYIRFSELEGYEEATVTTERGMVMMRGVRNNDRVMVDDVGRARQLFERLKESVPASFRDEWSPVGLNERLRLYRYDVGQQFDWHMDGYFERANGERSFFTFMVYLNDDFDGGATSFRGLGHGATPSDHLEVTPQKGMALLFHHPIEHRGDPVLAGRKYVLRTDVMYGRNAM